MDPTILTRSRLIMKLVTESFNNAKEMVSEEQFRPIEDETAEKTEYVVMQPTTSADRDEIESNLSQSGPNFSADIITLQTMRTSPPPEKVMDVEKTEDSPTILPANDIHNQPGSESSTTSSSSCSTCSSSSIANEQDFGGSDDSIKDPDYAVNESTSEESDDGSNSFTKNATADKEISKKRKIRPDLWKKEAAKRLRNLGKEYMSSSKTRKVVKERIMGKTCNDKCRLKCAEKITDKERRKIFDEYWSLGQLQRQREFISFCMDTIKPKYDYKREGSNRQNNHAFYFTIHERKIRVCKMFFKATLGITDRSIRTVLEKTISVPGGMVTSDLRGKHGNHPQIEESIKARVRDHIKSIPRVESHYCRKDSQREYIEGSKTIASLHRDYVDACKASGLPFANYLMYSRIFSSEFNISFHTPKKDQCENCVRFLSASEEDKETLKENYEKHLIERDLSRKEKERDKLNVNSNLIVAVYDLQAVLQCPRGDVSIFYYVSKINVFNFTIFELKSNDVKCFTWDETEANRGANEIGTCVLRYLESLQERANKTATKSLDVIFYSDNCCGQQKNRFILSMYLFAVKYIPFINSIEHKFLVKGHSQNEGDSAHAVIEREVTRSLKSGPIFIPQQYVTLIRTSKKKGKPYEVTEMNYEMFYDLKDLAAKTGLNVLKNTANENVKLSEIAILRFEKENPNTILYKTSYSEEEFHVILLRKPFSVTRQSVTNSMMLKRLYSTRPKIKDSKKEGLAKLVQKNIIPKAYSYFYNNL